jgi:hypothetical protein
LSAIYAWVYDDYGDKKRSLAYFDNRVPPEQIRIADRTRKLMAKEVGSFVDYDAALGKPIEDLPPLMKARLARIRTHTFTVQWVLSSDPKVAQDSFFKINQLATPLEPTELRILKARESANAVAARAITRAGAGHRYWRRFLPEVRQKIESQGRGLYTALYDPPMDEGYQKSLDVPVAGRGYNPLPFVFDLVNLANNQKITDSTAKRPIKEILAPDPSGERTLEYLQSVEKLVGRITGKRCGVPTRLVKSTLN